MRCEPRERRVLHLQVKFVRTVVELADIGFGVADSGVVGGDAGVGGLHTFEAEEGVLAIVLDQ